MAPDVGREYLRAVVRLRENLTQTMVEQIVARGDAEAVLRLIMDDREFVRAFIGYTREVRRGIERATIAYTKALPPAPRARVLEVGFDMLNPKVIESVRTLETRSLSTIQEEMRATVRQVVGRGITEGVNPRETARHLRSVIGLAPNQERAIANFEKALRAGDFSKALGYELRDGRSDPLLKRLMEKQGTLTEAQIDRQVKAYRQNWEAWNAETHARTASLDAQRLGQRLSWQQAKDSGALGDREITKKWVTARDDRVRPEHEDMDGFEIPFDSRWPVDGGVMVPGENAWNCRCLAIYRVQLRKAVVA